MQVKMTTATKKMEKLRENGQLTEELERELTQGLMEDMRPMLIDTLWYINKMDIS